MVSKKGKPKSKKKRSRKSRRKTKHRKEVRVPKSKSKILKWPDYKKNINSVYDIVKSKLSRMNLNELLDYTKKIVLLARSDLKKFGVLLNRYNEGVEPEVRSKLHKLWLFSSNSESVEYIMGLSKEELVEFTANLTVIVRPPSRNFDVKTYYGSLFRGRQKGRAHRSFKEH